MADDSLRPESAMLIQLEVNGIATPYEIEQDRRMAIKQRRPEKFTSMSMDQFINYVVIGIPFKNGHLDEWIHLNLPLPAHRNIPRLGKGGAFLIDHLPRRSLGCKPITVPWMGRKYDGKAGEFLQYPALNGFDMRELERGSFGEHTQVEGLAFLQSWLFFGLLKEALGGYSEVVYEDWVEHYRNTNVEIKMMKSPELARVLDRFARRLSKSTDGPPWEHWHAVFMQVMTVAERFDLIFGNKSSWEQDLEEPVPLRVTWSILTLGQMLTIVAREHFKMEGSPVTDWPDSLLLSRRLQSRKWCPHLRYKLSGLFSTDVLYFISLLPWTNPVNRFSTIRLDDVAQILQKRSASQEDEQDGLGMHVLCNADRCLGEEIDDALYKTSHTNSDCSCSCIQDYHDRSCQCNFVGPSVTDVIKILNDKEVPVFYIKQTLDEAGVLHISCEVSRSQKTEGYTAFSHVWADGLGNRGENKLPRCQVIRIAHMLRDFTGEDCPPFWIDTFGIPRHIEARKKALAVMDDTYRLAKRVLVLDAGLQQFSSYRALDEALENINVEIAEQVRMGICVELLLRIVLSSWTSRLWTLPEGMLGPELHFKFFDGTVELGNLVALLRTWPFVGTNLRNDLKSILVNLRPLLLTQRRLNLEPADPTLNSWPSCVPSGRFIMMLRALEQRDTSWKEDEAICLGIHLGLNVSAITSFKPDAQKLQAVFAQLQEIPSDLVFTHSPRLSHYPYRWAPLHLLRSMNDYLCIPAALPTSPMGYRTDRGLRMKCKSFVLYTQNQYIPNSVFMFFTSSAEGSGSESTLHNLAEEQCKHYGMMLAAKDPRIAREWTESRTAEAFSSGSGAIDLIILVGPEYAQGPPPNMEPGKMGLIVKEESYEDEITYCTPLDTVVMFRMPGPPNLNQSKIDSGELVHLRGLEMPGRLFCIG